MFEIRMVCLFCALAGAASAASELPKVIARYPLGGSGGWDYLAVDAATARVFLSRGDHVLVVDANSGRRVGEIADTPGVHSIVLVAELRRGYTSNGRANTVTEFDLGSLRPLRTIALGGRTPDAMIHDPHSRHLFAFNARSHDVSVIDPVAGRELTRIALDGKPEFAVSDGRGAVFVNIENTAELVRIDSEHNRVTARWRLADCAEPTDLALDAERRRLFSVCQNQRMAVTDADDGHAVASVRIGRGPDGAIYDAARHLVFSANGIDGTLSVIRQDSADAYRVLAEIPTQRSARTMALDPTTHRIYLAAAGADGFDLLVVGAEP